MTCAELSDVQRKLNSFRDWIQAIPGKPAFRAAMRSWGVPRPSMLSVSPPSLVSLQAVRSSGTGESGEEKRTESNCGGPKPCYHSALRFFTLPFHHTLRKFGLQGRHCMLLAFHKAPPWCSITKQTQSECAVRHCQGKNLRKDQIGICLLC